MIETLIYHITENLAKPMKLFQATQLLMFTQTAYNMGTYKSRSNYVIDRNEAIALIKKYSDNKVEIDYKSFLISQNEVKI